MKLLPLLLALSWTAQAQTVPADCKDPRQIMEAVEGQADGDHQKARLAMTITDHSGHERSRVVQSRAIDFEGGRRQLMIFESPADVKNTGLLSIDYDDGAKDDDQWLYLPSLHKSTRISSGDKSGSFMGTDFSYADMTRSDPDHYDYTLVEAEVSAQDESCWLIEARPKTEKAQKETGYLKTHVWISKAKLRPVQTKMWVREGKRLKFVTFRDFKQVSGIWVAHTLTARTKRGKRTESTTVLQFTDLSFDNADVTEADFTERRLEQGI